jgi:AbiU2
LCFYYCAVKMSEQSGYRHPDVENVKGKITKLRDEIVQLSATHELNAYLNYSDMIVEKVNKSFASNAFIRIQNEMFRAEIMGVCRIWDGPRSERFSLPSISKLISGSGFRANFNCYLQNSMSSLQTVWVELDGIDQEISEIRSSEIYRNIVNHRDEVIAHLLERKNNSENDVIKAKTYPRYGDEEKLFVDAKRLTTKVYSLLMDGSINFEAYAELHKNEAKSFAESISFLTTYEFNKSKTQL